MMDTEARFTHQVALPAGSEPAVAGGQTVKPGDTLARTFRAGSTISLPVARRLRRKREEIEGLLLARPGERMLANQPIARTPQRDVRAPAEALYLGYQATRGSAQLLTLEPDSPVVSDVRGTVSEIGDSAVTITVTAGMLRGAGATGPAVHGELAVMVAAPDVALEPGAIDADAAGKIVVGGSWASGEAITRARAVGVAGIVVGSLHARDLADFAGLQHRRSLLGTAAPPFAVMALDGFGRAGMDPARFAWLEASSGRFATLIGDRRTLLVYDAAPPPPRAPRPKVGDRVLIVAGPGRGQTGLLAEIPPQPRAIGSGISALCGLVHLDSGRAVTVALANLEASRVDD